MNFIKYKLKNKRKKEDGNGVIQMKEKKERIKNQPFERANEPEQLKQLVLAPPLQVAQVVSQIKQLEPET